MKINSIIMRSSPRRTYCALLSVRQSVWPVPTVNSQTEHCITFKLWGAVTHVSGYWLSNFKVKRLKVKVSSGAEMWTSFWCTSSRKMHRFTLDASSVLHILSNTIQQRTVRDYRATSYQLWWTFLPDSLPFSFISIYYTILFIYIGK